MGNNLQDHALVGTFYPCKLRSHVPASLDADGGQDNNASYPLPTELTTNASYNAMAEMEYNSFKTGERVVPGLASHALMLGRSMDSRLPECPCIQSFAPNQQQLCEHTQWRQRPRSNGVSGRWP